MAMQSVFIDGFYRVGRPYEFDFLLELPNDNLILKENDNGDSIFIYAGLRVSYIWLLQSYLLNLEREHFLKKLLSCDNERPIYWRSWFRIFLAIIIILYFVIIYINMNIKLNIE